MHHDPHPPADTPPGDHEPGFDLVLPAIALPSSDIMTIAGEEALRALVKHHHQRLRRSSIGDRFPADERSFDAVVGRIANFIVNTVRGSPPFAPDQGRTWLRVRHFPFLIDETARNVWLAELLASFDEVGFPRKAQEALWVWLEALSIVIINRRTTITQPRRYAFADAAAALRPFIRTTGT